ncbi:MAG: hypothetical protein J6S83_09140 [Lachnospiraceae bacterium]|nr:hypothetical protein [Lachnospiraceae bacterium]
MLNYQHFQMFGWLCIVLTAVSGMLSLGAKFDEGLAKGTSGLLAVLAKVTEMSLPFLLIANFSRILNNSEGYKKQLLRNSLAAAALYGFSWLFFSRYVVGLASQVVKQPEQLQPLMNDFFAEHNREGFVAFNLFIDLLLCTLTMYFLNAHPKRVFTGRKVIVLRLFALLPIAYEAASIWLKIQSALGNIVLPFWSFPLLTVKPPMTFLLFLFLSLHMSGRELRFRKNGRTHEDYLEYLKTNRNAFHFSVCLAVAMVAATFLDFILAGLVSRIIAGTAGIPVENSEQFVSCLLAAKAAGFGQSWPLLFAAPVVLLYSYNKVPKQPLISILIPLAAIVIIILLVFEAVYQGISYFVTEDRKIDIDMIRTILPQITQMLSL